MIDRDLVRSLAPIMAGTFVAMIPMETAPFLIGGAAARAALTSEQAGWIGTVSVGGVAAGSMLASSFLRTPRFRQIMLGCVLLVALSYAMLTEARSFAGYLVLGAAGGGAAGVILAGMATRVAEFPDPDQAYGFIYSAVGIVFAFLLLALPMVNASGGATAMYLLIAAAAVAGLLGVLRLPPGHRAERGADDPAPQRIAWRPVLLLVLVMSIAFPLYGGTYGFVERKAIEVAMPPGTLGGMMFGATLLSITGTLTVAMVGTRFGRALPMLLVMALATLAYFLTLRATTQPTLLIGFWVFGFMQLALNSYFFGLASALDPAGRVAAALQGYSLVPYALGPGLFGTLVGNAALPSLAVPVALVNVVATLLLLPLILRRDRSRDAAPAALSAA